MQYNSLSRYWNIKLSVKPPHTVILRKDRPFFQYLPYCNPSRSVPKKIVPSLPANSKSVRETILNSMGSLCTNFNNPCFALDHRYSPRWFYNLLYPPFSRHCMAISLVPIACQICFSIRWALHPKNTSQLLLPRNSYCALINILYATRYLIRPIFQTIQKTGFYAGGYKSFQNIPQQLKVNHKF